MLNYICTTCGHQYAKSEESPDRCLICEDDRQYVNPQGQSWTTKWEMPNGFCRWAWEDLRKDRYLLYFGGNIPDMDEGLVYVSCSDGMRPVVFKLERLNE